VVVLVPGGWTVEVAHAIADEVEATLGAIVPNATVVTHLEPHPL
jgi:divalent metal cation (Fe/Co/Zn/Cd) transporter